MLDQGLSYKKAIRGFFRYSLEKFIIRIDIL